MTLFSILFDNTNTLRSGWRFAVFVMAFIFFGSIAGLITVGFLMAVSTPAEPGTALLLTVNGIVSSAVALSVGWLCAKYLERLPFRSLGATLAGNWLVNLVLGLLIGGAALALAAFIGMIPGGLSFRFNSEASLSAIGYTLAVTFAIFAAAAAFEEALLRGYILQTFVRSNLSLFAVFFTSLVFATLHNANPNATWLSWLNTFLAGVWLAVAYLKTRDLWLPLGVHLSWNWVQGSIFGVEVSGLTKIVEAPLMRESDNGPAWLTGGDYGIEGGVACTIALIVSTIAVHYMPFLSPDDELLAMTRPKAEPTA